MIEYKLLGKNNSPITCDNTKYVGALIKSVFPRKNVETNNMGEIIRQTYGKNGSAFHIYYRYKESRILIPKKVNSRIKNKLESTAELNLGRLN